jgi:uncharacterized protein (DUF697 family)/tellurite resistance protein
MNTTDHAPLIAIAMLAARADGRTDSREQQAVDAVVARIGNPDVTRLALQVAAGKLRVADLASRLSDDDARRVAYEGALAVCNADGVVNTAEQAFLEELRTALGLSAESVATVRQTAGALAGAPVAEVHTGAPPAGPLDELILQQAMLTGALEILPDRLATIAVLPLQLRLVYQIGQRHGQKLDVNQVKDLAATLGLGVAAQGMESVVLKLAGGLAGGLLGGLVGGATRVATGAVITFAATYALGHVADQYYEQGRSLSAGDLRAAFDRFQQDAKTIYPKVEAQIRAQSGTLNLQSLLQSLRTT